MQKWRQGLGLLCTAGLCVVGLLCAAQRLPALPEGAALLTAAGLTMPRGALAAVRQGFPPAAAASDEPNDMSGAKKEPTPSLPTPALPAGHFVPDKADTPVQAPIGGTVADALSAGVKETTLQNSGLSFENIWVRNSNKNHALDIAAELQKQPAVKLKRDGSVEILIYHTHTTEAYAGLSRSRDNTQNMVAVGEELAAQLRAAGFGVAHDSTCHDYPSYTGSYDRSGKTIQNNLKKHPGIQVTLDVHRDGMTQADGTKIKPTVVVNGQKAAQLMLISGCDDNGKLSFPDWEMNLRLALRIQKSLAGLYPGLARPLSFSPTKYNGHMTKGSLLVEIGTEVSTLSEAKHSARLLGAALAQALAELK